MELSQGHHSEQSTNTLSADLTAGAATIHNTGKRPLYLYVAESGVPQNKAPAAADRGLAIRRHLLDQDGQPIDTDAIPVGTIVLVEIELQHAGDLDHLVIDELLPAGLEIEQPHLPAHSPLVAPTKAHQLPVASFDARDDRLLIFPGPFRRTGVYRYLTRAVTPGTYRLPPIQVEAMYDPSRGSRTAPSTLTVLPE